MKTALESARAYLAKLPAAVSGAGGHRATFAAACWCVRLGLDDSDAMALLREFNQRCQPPWKEAELAHKLRDARRVAGGQVRNFRQAAPAVRLVWKVERRVEQANPKSGSPASVARLISTGPLILPPPAPQRLAPQPPVLEPQRPVQITNSSEFQHCVEIELTERHTLRPGDAIPGRLLPVLATWKALRQHPAWAGVQWPKIYENRPTKIRA